MPPPARDAMRAKHSYQRQLRVLVPARADARHHIAALGFAKDIRHGILLTRSEPECTRIPMAHGRAALLRRPDLWAARQRGPTSNDSAWAEPTAALPVLFSFQIPVTFSRSPAISL